MTSPEKNDFIKRWREKAISYDPQTLVGCFDRFFTGWVLYNYLYNEIESQKPKEKKLKRDGLKATQGVIEYLSDELLFGDDQLCKNGDLICAGLEAGNLNVSDYPDEEREHLATIRKHEDSAAWSKSLFWAIYKIRCNLVHGEKDFRESQIAVLRPCIEIIEVLVEKMIKRLEN